MNKRFKQFFSLFLSAVMIFTVFAGCSRNEKLIDFIYPFSANVNSYDPQVASTADEFLIIENTFEGLVRTLDDGTVVKGCAESWDISKDGLTYTFHIKRGLKWNIDHDKYTEGENKGKFKDERLRLLGRDFDPDITANDFVFALRRAVSPETNSPLFASVSAIKNAVKIHNGKLSADKLGVAAKDAYTLTVSLSSPDGDFLQTLSSSVAMPCNAEFFNATGGRYGLETKYTLFNGQFYLSQILESSYLLKRNKFYNGPSPANAGELTLKIPDESSNTVELLQKGYYDAAFITGHESSKLTKAKGISYIPYEDTTWAFLFNTANEVFQSKTMRKAFCTGLSEYSGSKKYLNAAKTLTPRSCTIGGAPSAEKTGSTVLTPNTEESIRLWEKGLKVINETDITITIITPKTMQDEVRALLQGIQSGIGTVVKNSEGEPMTFTVKVEPLEDAELKTRVLTRNYDLAFYPFVSTSDSAEAFLDTFTENSYTGFNTDKLEKALTSSVKATDKATEAAFIKQAENEIIGTYSIYPAIYETSYYAAANGVDNIQFHAGTGRVSFVNATRKE